MAGAWWLEMRHDGPGIPPYIVIEFRERSGQTYPLGEKYRDAREFCDAVDFAIHVIVAGGLKRQ